MPDNKEHLRQKADEILQEIRIVLPGTEALLGFQFVTFFNPVFQSLPAHLKYIHLGTLMLTMVCTVLLIAPVTFQQIGEDGHLTKKFMRFTRKMLNFATGFLLVALTGNAFLAARTINASSLVAGLVAGSVFVVGVTFWYAHVLVNWDGKKRNSE